MFSLVLALNFDMIQMNSTVQSDFIFNRDLTYNRQDFWVTTSNKQLNFVQRVRTMLKATGKAAIVVPDKVLFEGGAGETVRSKLLETTDLRTILRLPTGIFYAHGIKANVLFFDSRPAAKEPQTKDVWFYDYRTNIYHTLKKKPLRFEDFKEFIKLYNQENRHERKETWDPEKNPRAGGANSPTKKSQTAIRPALISYG